MKQTNASILESLRNRERTVTDLIQQTFEGLSDARELNAVAHDFKSSALARAQESARRYVANKPLSALDGLPFAIKDNLSLKGEKMSCASNMLRGYVAPYTATVVQRLLDAGAIPVCSSNMDEFAMGATGETSAYGATKNPLDARRSPGGSSSGCAALVALGCVPFALGSDTGGSVRLPASHCGIYGFKPTYGALSRYGLTAYASSLDQVGLLTNSADDLAQLYDVLSLRQDPRDCTCTGDSGRLVSIRSLRDVAILPVQNLLSAANSEVQSALHPCMERLKRLCPVFPSVEMPGLSYVAPAYYVIACAEASSNLGRYDGIRYGIQGKPVLTMDEQYAENRMFFGNEVKKRIRMGAYVLSQDHYAAYYLRAKHFAARLSQWFSQVLTDRTFLLAPVSPTPAPFLGAVTAVQGYAADLMTAGVNLAGLPAVSLPFARAENGLPVGLQLIAAHGNDKALLQVAKWLSQEGMQDV